MHPISRQIHVSPHWMTMACFSWLAIRSLLPGLAPHHVLPLLPYQKLFEPPSTAEAPTPATSSHGVSCTKNEQNPIPTSPRSPLLSAPLPLHPFPDELFPFFLLLLGEPPGPQEPLGLILEGGQVPAGAGGEGIAAPRASYRAGGRCL